MPAHFRREVAILDEAAANGPGWGQTQRWGLAGATPSSSIYDADFGASAVDLHRQITGGTESDRELLPPSEYTMTRSGLVGAQLSSLAAARFFQSYDGAGTGRAEVSGVAAWTPRSLAINFNPNQQGAAELHPATVYAPFPAPAELYPKVV